MAYTNIWNESVPVGGDAANTADDLFRQAKLDFRERLNSVMGYATGAAFTDPVIPAGAGMMASQSLALCVPVWQMAWTSAAGTLVAPNNNTAVGLAVVQATHTTGYFWFSFVLPVGSIVPAASCELSFEQSAGTIVYDIRGYARPKTANTNTTIITGSGTGALTGVQNVGFGPAADYTILADTYYSVGFYVTPSAGTTCTVYGVKIRYNSPDIRVRY